MGINFGAYSERRWECGSFFGRAAVDLRNRKEPG